MIFGVRALEAERMRLVARCDALRGELVQGIRPCAAKIVAADRLVRAVRRLAPLLVLYSFLKKR